MALNIDGTTGISGVDGSASAPALQGTDSNTGINFGSDTVNINTGGVTRATVDSSGRLLVGTSTEGQGSADDLTIATSGDTGITLRSGTSNAGSVFFSDGTSGADEYRGYVQYEHANNALTFATNAAERIRIDSSGNVGFGTTPRASTGLHISRAGGESKIELQRNETNTTGNVGIINFTASDGHSVANIGAFGDGDNEGAHLVFKTTSAASDNSPFGTNTTERMRITSGGLVGINESSPSKVLEVANTGITNFSCCFMHADGSDNVRVMGLRSDRASGGTNAGMIEFFNSNGSNVGNIQSNGSSTSYNTSSDYRLKENATAISDGITRLKTLKPYRFNWKVDPTTTVDGFFAHEVTAVPEAIIGTKDQVATADDVNDEIKEGDPIYQSIDQSKLVPLLTAALQEAVAKIEVLETKVAALEAA